MSLLFIQWSLAHYKQQHTLLGATSAQHQWPLGSFGVKWGEDHAGYSGHSSLNANLEFSLPESIVSPYYPYAYHL